MDNDVILCMMNDYLANTSTPLDNVSIILLTYFLPIYQNVMLLILSSVSYVTYLIYILLFFVASFYG